MAPFVARLARLGYMVVYQDLSTGSQKYAKNIREHSQTVFIIYYFERFDNMNSEEMYIISKKFKV
jgi:hypothetical protein